MSDERASWSVVLRRFARLGLLGFGGPPAHILMMRRQWVESHDVSAEEFHDAVAAVSLLPGPASTQLAMWLGWRSRGWRGLLVAAGLFVIPAVASVLVLARFVLSAQRPSWLGGAALGAAAVVPAIALRASYDIVRGYPFSLMSTARLIRLSSYVVAGLVVCILSAPLLPVVMILAGALEVAVSTSASRRAAGLWALGSTKSSLVIMALKVGALSFGGGFVIVPIMRGDAVGTHHWMTATAFVSAVAIGQLTPGPVVATVAAVGYAAGGWVDGVLAAAVAFAPSLLFVGLGSRHLSTWRVRPAPRAFLEGAGPCATGAIAASAVVLARTGFFTWQWPIVALAAATIVVARRSPTIILVLGAAAGILAAVIWHSPTG